MPSRRAVLLGGAAVGAGLVGGGLLLRGRQLETDYSIAAETLWTPRSLTPSAGDAQRLGFLLHHARLAANSHNSQPWRFAANASGVSIRPDFDRRLPVADPDDHHLYASLGCAAENLRLAAAELGQAIAHEFIPGAQVELWLGFDGGAQADPLFMVIAERQCTRSDYSGHAVSEPEALQLQQAARLGGCELMLIPPGPRMEQVLELILTANAEQVANPAFAQELQHWVRFNPEEALHHGDGLYAACSGNPSLPSWLGPRMFPWVFTPAAENDRYARQIRSSAGLALFHSERDEPAAWVEAGRSCQRFALQATALGIRHAFVNQAVEVPAVRAQLASLLGLGTRRPDLLLRYGYAAPMPRSLRRPLDAVIDAV